MLVLISYCHSQIHVFYFLTVTPKYMYFTFLLSFPNTCILLSKDTVRIVVVPMADMVKLSSHRSGISVLPQLSLI